MLGSKHIHTTAYHPQSNGLIERWHRSFKAALMCHSEADWTELLPTVLRGLRTCYKLDIDASAADLHYGGYIRLPNEFYDDLDKPINPQDFAKKFRDYMRMVRPVPTAHHVKKSMFIYKHLTDCSLVLLRTDAVRQPLEPPYLGPYEVGERSNDRVYIININGRKVAVSTERLKPAFFIKDCPESEVSTTVKTYQRNKKVRFAPGLVTGKGVDVATSGAIYP
ncbi:uncharacterized protein LOC118755848 [Rhagoletis pomonella]|uniref:uncharacterized protein LOC118755846 n=1 Tax=Rhagoletis pomonella TaxID=28610 RepID=UPI001782091D|nr:uncharacterized protein LOC118755846 [Rhagoletis pomonella]XP_036346548.1 uncharacterized protein LOC118755848 [Rhagoletis pomonella]